MGNQRLIAMAPPRAPADWLPSVTPGTNGPTGGPLPSSNPPISTWRGKLREVRPDNKTGRGAFRSARPPLADNDLEFVQQPTTADRGAAGRRYGARSSRATGAVFRICEVAAPRADTTGDGGVRQGAANVRAIPKRRCRRRRSSSRSNNTGGSCAPSRRSCP